MSLAGRDLITMSDLSLAEIGQLMDSAAEMAEAIGFDDPATRQTPAPLDRIMATCFFEPSTRTRLSFESAMLRLGGSVLGFADPSASSVAKGETLADTARIVSGYADIIVIRHPRAGAAKVAADAADVPVINAGDGPHAHPTQTLTDLFCIKRRFGRLDGLTVGLFGDLKYGRTVHSLGPVLARLGSRVVCIAPPELAMPPRYLDEIEELGGKPVRQVSDVGEVLSELDVLYVTRVQAERFPTPEQARKAAGSYIVDAGLLARAPQTMIVMHPLPRVDEIDPQIDYDPRAAYFEQAAGGVPVRMALVAHLLGLIEEARPAQAGFERGHREAEPETDRLEPGRARPQAEADTLPASADLRCSNDKCITWEERFLTGFFQQLPSGGLRCGYCEEDVKQ
ncbi:MAG: aspartate carbamoyltransferase [Armatimonadota bacterium]